VYIGIEIDLNKKDTQAKTKNIKSPVVCVPAGQWCMYATFYDL
jgi:hypothetical protein